MLKSNKTKVIFGILISLIFLYLSFNKVDFSQMGEAFAQANYWYILLGLFVLLFSHFLRALRWGFLLKPIQDVEITPLFNSLIIGYMFNVILPAHLGEFVRAYILGKKKQISSSAIFGTIVIERIIDVFSLLIILAFAIVIFPFPNWVKTSGYVSFIFIILLFLLLILMKRYREKSLVWISKFTKPLPEKLGQKIKETVYSFLDGVVPLKRLFHYFMVLLLSILIWAAYGYVFHLVFYSFNFIHIYSLPWYAALVLLVITTISVLVPSSPGYVGTYHYLCQLSLGLFLVPKSPALSFAVVMHGLNFLPVLVFGLILIFVEGLSIRGIQDSLEVQGEDPE